MVAVNYNFDIEKGSDFEISFVYNGPDGNPINLNDKCVLFSLVPTVPTTTSTPTQLAQTGYNNTATSTSDPAYLTANDRGLISLYLSAKETNKYNFLSATYDLDVRDLSGFSNTRISQGAINIISRNSNLDIDNFGNFTCNVSVQELTPLEPTDPDNPTVTPTGTSTPIVTELDLCLPYDCGPLDLFSVVYSGSGPLILSDSSTVSGQLNPYVVSDQTLVTNTGIITNVELAVNQLSHNNPSDLVFLLAPPSGDKILLSANSKIINFNNNFSFMFSNKAGPGSYLYNIPNGQTCNILDKTNIFNYNNENLNSSFSGLFGSSITGVWDFIVMDTDPLGSGSINSWKLIITYENNIPENTDPFECAVPP
jgi:subtilisin-like proprotein convertase family protein